LGVKAIAVKTGRSRQGDWHVVLTLMMGSYDDFEKYFSNRSGERFAPSSVKTTDFALVTGSEM